MRLISSSLLLGLAQLALSQSVAEDLAKALQDSNGTTLFQALLTASPALFSVVLGDKTEGITVLVPDDDAVTQFAANNKVTSIGELSPEAITTVLKYHILDSADITKEQYVRQLGLVVPTLLTDSQFNNRSAGAAIAADYGSDAKGQILYFSKDAIPAVVKRQGGDGAIGNTIVNVRAGLATQAKMTVIDGTFSGGKNKFQLVDQVLAPPQPCSTTIQNPEKEKASEKLKALDDALKKTELYPALDTSPNVTCLAPTTDAFAKAGNPQQTLGKKDLSDALLFHTLNEVTYTSYLKDGQKIGTVSGATVTVRIDGQDIYFNDAKVIEPNVITNNGLIHILDKIMDPNGTAPIGSGSDEPSGTDGGDKPEETDESVAAVHVWSGTGAVVAILASVVLF